jgi:hypothetical protein
MHNFDERNGTMQVGSIFFIIGPQQCKLSGKISITNHLRLSAFKNISLNIFWKSTHPKEESFTCYIHLQTDSQDCGAAGSI